MGTWNDGGVPFGARKVKFFPTSSADASGNTIWSASAKGIYILENWTPTRPQYTQKRYDEVRQPNGAFGVDDFAEASATVQLAYQVTPLIATSDAFTTLQRNGSAESWVVISADEPEAQGDIRKQPIRLQKLIASPSGNLPVVYP